MVDFSKRVAKKRQIDVSDPIKLFETLDRQSTHTTLRNAQVKALEEIRIRRNSRDLVLKMNTGEGKTTAALLYLKSHMSEKKRPGVYLCPNIQLVNQVTDEALKLGVEAVNYPADDPLPEVSGTAGDAVIVCTYKKLFNAKTTFDRSDVLLRPCALVLDDAHAGIEEIRNAFTLQLANCELHKEVIKLFDSTCEKYSPGTWESIRNQDPQAFLEVPYWLWKPVIGQINKIITPASQEKPFCFIWPFLKEHIRWCRCVISGVGIEISPDILPLFMVNAYNEANHRLFMSATLADDSILVRELDCDPDAARSPIIQVEDKGLGERMVLAPSLVDKKLSREWIMKLCQGISSRVNVVVLAPSEKMARDWEPYGASVALGDDVISHVNRLREKKVNFVVFAQRYDGIDLPDNSCRILVIDGMPYGQGITDRYDSERVKHPGGTRNRLIYRIEQGMGRAIRSHADYAVVILAGPELSHFIAKREVLDLMNIDTKAQLELAQVLAKIAIDDTSLKPDEAVIDMMRKCINRDTGWKQFYAERVRNAPKIERNIDITKSINMAYAEQIALQSAISHAPDKSVETLSQAIANSIESEIEKGYYLQKMANYKYELNPGEALELQRMAHDKNGMLFCPPQGIIKHSPSITSFQPSELILSWYNEFNNVNGTIAELQTLRAKLSYDGRPKTLEQAVKDLSKPIGAIGKRPEAEFGVGPDDLWLWGQLAFVIEVKNECTILSKRDSGQLHDSLQWFKNNYPGRESVPIIITKTTDIAKNANFSTDTRLVTPELMNKLLDNLDSFIGEMIKQTPLFWKPQKLNELQSQYHLLPHQFCGNYTRKCLI